MSIEADSLFDLRDHLAPFLPQDEKTPVAVGVSGGPDSMALCHALSRCGGGGIHALSVDHGLRPDSAAEARQVGVWVEGWPGVRHMVLKRQVGGAQTRIQEEARRDRYALMAGYCEEQGINHLFVAHHLDDQAETFLFRLAKGSGLDGLGAMRPVHDYNDQLQIVRPFLDIPKAGLVAYCEHYHIPYFTDPSNENKRFARARLRKAYDVLAAEGLTPKRLAVTARRLARARQALDFYTEKLWEQAAKIEPDRIILHFSRLEKEPEETRLRLLIKAMESLKDRQDYGPRMEKLEALAGRLFYDADFKKASLGGCLFRLDRKEGLIVIETEPGKPI